MTDTGWTWAEPIDEVFARLSSSVDGLSGDEAAKRATNTGFHNPAPMSWWRLAVRQLDSPIVLLLLGATVLSILLGDLIDGAIILAITAASATLGFVQERGAVRVVEDLLDGVRVHADARRDGVDVQVPLDAVVPGDVLILRTGDVIAGDARIIDAQSMLLDESALTGESFPSRSSRVRSRRRAR